MSVLAVTLSPAVSYGIRSGTAVLAVVVLLRIGQAPGRTSRVLLAAALLVGIVSGVLATAHLVLTGHPSPPGGAADWVYLCYGPLAAAGLLALPRHPTEAPWRLMALTDAVIAVTALGFVLSGLMLDMARTSGATLVARAAALGYPLGSVFVLAVLVAVLPRAQEDLRPFLRAAGTGLALLTLSDVGYAVATLDGWYAPTSWPAVASQAGLVLVALAPLQGRRAAHLVEREPEAPSLLEMAAPLLTLVPSSLYVVIMLARGEPLSRVQMALVTITAAAVVARGLLTGADQRHNMARLKKREGEALGAARRDPLTGLGNRTALYEELAALLERTTGAGVALALLDLDDFKDINDTQGHATGDAVLTEVAARLRQAAPPGAVVARLGGDEFAVCVPTTHGPTPLGEALLGAFRSPVQVGIRAFTVTASIGVVMADADGADAALALSHVDLAMYEAKSGKEPQRSSVVVLKGREREQAAGRVQLRDDLSRPDLSQFHLVYEPLVDLRHGRVVGAEALLRWEHPELGSIGPTQFIALAEQVGAIAELGEFALRTAARDLAGWLREAEQLGAPIEVASVGVNLSPRQLGLPHFPELVRSVLEEHGLEPHRLVLEITEEALLDDWETAVNVVQGLRALGVAIAVDDFGTGYSSLRYLRRFDVSTVKVDREFTQAVVDEPRTRSLVASVMDMVHSLDLYSVAEGIETLDQLLVMRALGCHFAQGYLFDKPMLGDAFGALLVGRHRYPLGAHPQEAAQALPVPREEVRPATAVSPRKTG
ncbi:MAG: diguanylate cyclase/phosphodiesterase with sensor(s) [Frankiales bacterium]|nr:diguanylate cyclase/phosphodiesterase with sensor(s) [Frankiales bacterium]